MNDVYRCGVDAAPIDLYTRNPVAFLLYVELYEKPRGHVSLADVRRITDTGEKESRAAVRDLVKLCALVRVGADLYRPANAPAVESVTPVLTCRWCHGPLPKGRRIYCSAECTGHAQVQKRTARRIEARGAYPDLYCLICGSAITGRPRSGHQKFCSRACKRVAEHQKELERDIAAGTAGTCETCGKPMRASSARWCSRTCQTRSRTRH